MAHAKVLNRFTYKGKTYEKGDEMVISEKNLPRYEKLNYVKSISDNSKGAGLATKKPPATK